MKTIKTKNIRVINKKLVWCAVAVFAVIGVVLYLLYGRGTTVTQSSVDMSKTSTSIYKTKRADSKYILDTNESYNHKQELAAKKSGQSYLASMGSVNTVKPTPKAQEVTKKDNPSPYDWMQKQDKKPAPKPKPKSEVKKDDGIELSKAFNDALKDALKEKKNNGNQQVSFTTVVSPDYISEALATKDQPVLASFGSINAGTTLYGVIDNKINTDYKDTPAIATIKIGKYAGAKLIGKFGVNEKWVSGVTITFNKMIYKGFEFKVNAIATNADYQPNLYDDVNNHWFQRIGGLLAGAGLGAIKGAAKPYEGANQPTIIVSGGGQTQPIYTPPDGKQITYSAFGGAAGDMSGQLEPTFKAMWNRPATITVDTGHAIGILFVETASLKESESA